MKIHHQKNTSVCVSGMGCVCAAGLEYTQFLQAKTTLSSQSILHKDAMPYPFFAAPEEAFGGKRLFSAKDTLHLALYAAEKALYEARVSPSSPENTKSVQSLGVVLGTTAGSALHFLDGYAKSKAEEKTTSMAQDIEEYFAANLALSLAQKLHCHGPAITVANACTSGADAIGLGMDMIIQGQCSMVICGGADALSLVPHTGFARLMIYSKDLCRPFDAQRQGLNLGEGAGIVVLENTEHALARGITPLGYIAGYGSFADAHHFTAPHPEARGLQRAVDAALHAASITADNLAFINAHGTATPENDKVEGAFFHKHFSKTPVWGSKSITGHTLGAAGAIEAIFCLLALQQRKVPATIGFEHIDPNIGLAPTISELDLQPSQQHYALSTSLGFGGSNAALVLKGVM